MWGSDPSNLMQIGAGRKLFAIIWVSTNRGLKRGFKRKGKPPLIFPGLVLKGLTASPAQVQVLESLFPFYLPYSALGISLPKRHSSGKTQSIKNLSVLQALRIGCLVWVLFTFPAPYETHTALRLAGLFPTLSPLTYPLWGYILSPTTPSWLIHPKTLLSISTYAPIDFVARITVSQRDIFILLASIYSCRLHSSAGTFTILSFTKAGILRRKDGYYATETKEGWVAC